MDNDLDMSWIQEYSRIHSIQQIMNKEELDMIVIQTIYMNTQKQITKIDKEIIHLNIDSNRYISKEQLLKIIQNKKQVDKTTYNLFDMLLFTLDLEPKDIQKYVNGECNNIAKLKSLATNTHSIIDIIIPPSLFIFHSLHTFFLLFIEIGRTPEIGTSVGVRVLSGDGLPSKDNKSSPDNTRTEPIKSILKTTQSDTRTPNIEPIEGSRVLSGDNLLSKDNKRQTKKVRIADNIEVIQHPKHKKTRKNIAHNITPT